MIAVSIEIKFPVIFTPFPAVRPPPPVNCTKVIFVDPIVIELLLQLKAISEFTVPSLTNTEALTSSAHVSASSARVGAPLVFAKYIPFSVAVVWFFMRILSLFARTTPSIVCPAANAVASTPFAVVATRTGSFHREPATALSKSFLFTASVELTAVGTVTVPVKVAPLINAPEIEGEVQKTRAPDPVSSNMTVLRFALVGAAKKAATPPPIEFT